MPDPAQLLAASRHLAAGGATDAALRAASGLLYRSFEHTHMRTTFGRLDTARLPDRLRVQLGRQAASVAVRELAAAFVNLQERRHRADYDPEAASSASDAMLAISVAEGAIEALDRIPDDELTDVLALLMVKPRS